MRYFLKSLSVTEFFCIVLLSEMKSAQKHTISFVHCLVILSGIVLYSILPVDKHFGEHDLSHSVTYENDYESINEPEEKDSNHSSDILELTFKETPEKKESSKGMSGLAILKQGITATEVGFSKLTLDKSCFFKRTKHLSIGYSLVFINKTVNYLFLPFQPFNCSIAINAP